jgi:hypothetical protein
MASDALSRAPILSIRVTNTQLRVKLTTAPAQNVTAASPVLTASEMGSWRTLVTSG